VEALQLWVRWPVDDDRLSREVRRDGEGCCHPGRQRIAQRRQVWMGHHVHRRGQAFDGRTSMLNAASHRVAWSGRSPDRRSRRRPLTPSPGGDPSRECAKLRPARWNIYTPSHLQFARFAGRATVQTADVPLCTYDFTLSLPQVLARALHRLRRQDSFRYIVLDYR
jgi:hypothetical protein